MEKDNLIAISSFCTQYEIEFSFIRSLQELDLLPIITIDEEDFIQPFHLKNLERMMRMHYELDINIEGIEAILHLLDRITMMQNEIIFLKNKLQFYEGHHI